MYFHSPRPTFPRRGITLVEMLVTVALLVLLMTVLVQIFQAATGAVSAARAYQELDGSLRQADSTIRQDLGNVTARMRPPLNPRDNLGYFEYIENSFADLQGEDTDDCLRFTVKAPEGQTFTGRFCPVTAAFRLAAGGGLTQQFYDALKHAVPITIESQYAEVIYFLRNGNLYRRVLLVAPDKQGAMVNVSSGGLVPNPAGGFTFDLVGGIFSANAGPISTASPQMAVSWLGLNDLSASPGPTVGSNVLLNTLGDLTNRERRAFSPRFINEFPLAPAPSVQGQPDDYNADSVPDFWPSIYFNMASNGMIHELALPAQTPIRTTYGTFQTMAFPFIYPYAYSRPDPSGLQGLGWIHSPDSKNTARTITALMSLNHSPLDIGDSLPAPVGTQTWWGFPTWRETMSPNWTDPLWTPTNGQQAMGLNPYPASSLATGPRVFQFLPPMTQGLVGSVSGANLTGVTTTYRNTPQLFNDGTITGWDTFAAYSGPTQTTSSNTWPVDILWKQLWEDDLLMSGVRSFDVKAYDDSFPGYVDLGWGDDGRLNLLQTQVSSTANLITTWTPPLLGALKATPFIPGQGIFAWPPTTVVGANGVTGGSVYDMYSLYSSTYAHEGRIPPLAFDSRVDYQAPYDYINGGPRYLGDDTTSVVRLRRVWDTWSTDYSNAPATGTVPPAYAAANPTLVFAGMHYGLGYNIPKIAPFPPIYPSFPPPYPMPLRGIQVQIRVVDPRNERVKVLTIRQDFSDRI